jgi:Fe-S-cluster-containing hydrogenase component 2
MAEFIVMKGLSIAEEKRDVEILDGALSEAQKERISRFSCISDDAHAVRMKALHCMGCGICLSLCDSGAISMVDGAVEIDPEKCIGCGKCLHPCVVVDFGPR